MKRLGVAVLLSLVVSVGAGGAEMRYDSFEGTWIYGRTWTSLNGDLVIKNCDGKECDFEINTAYGTQLCGAEGKMKIVSPQKGQYHKDGEYGRKSSDITFTLDPAGTTWNARAIASAIAD